MSSKGKTAQTSTFEMETKENFNQIIEAINGLRQDFTKRFDRIEAEQVEIKNEQVQIKNELTELKNHVEVQFEAVRQGIVKNYQYDKIESKIAQNRAVIFSTKAAVGELHERVYLLTGSTEHSLK